MALQAIRNVIPLFDRVLIKKAQVLTETKGGIVLPEKSQIKIQRGTVVAIGTGKVNEKGETVNLSIKVGDEVLLPEYGGTKVELGDKEYHLFREAEILAKVEGPDVPLIYVAPLNRVSDVFGIVVTISSKAFET